MNQVDENVVVPVVAKIDSSTKTKIKIRIKRKVPAAPLEDAIVSGLASLALVPVPAALVPDALDSELLLGFKALTLVPALVPVPEPAQQHSIWMTMRRAPKAKPVAIQWPTEDITDDEADIDELERRAHVVSKNREKVRRILYEDHLYDLQYAGLFLNW